MTSELERRLSFAADTLALISKIATERFEGSRKLRADDARQFKRIADLADEALALANPQEKI